ncbi:BTAD domain-containing putative transcriptional regulator [Streptomyces calidiresistens]|uniref:SARP family transcriptional regulator n=1 Tax=Streptomyces calidiresistens TaxID=1485586 RepID=A0A7W3XX06_9ACTN|nr:AfsR/SARP family transcriptional regulator [Streptomyces calidiresistens]MBB0230615.1 SARP family transcriptional regulator [Streptomyces calidiresistens]
MSHGQPRTPVRFDVLGPLTARDPADRPIPLRGPRHRALLARLIIARGRVVPLPRLVADLWPEPPASAVPTVRTFVAALRRALEPDRPPRSPARLLVTEGPGYALRAEAEAVDARRFERAVASAAGVPAAEAFDSLREARDLWRGPALADFTGEPWARGERLRLEELRLHAVERWAAAGLELGRTAEVAADLAAHTEDHPDREEGRRLLALALYRSGRQGEALGVLRRARSALLGKFGVDPGPALRALETDILHQAPHLTPTPGAGTTAGPAGDPTERLWASATAAWDRTVPAGSRARLESTAGLLRRLALTGPRGLPEARRHRWSAVEAAEELGDPELTARVIGLYDVPALWTRLDDPARAARVVAAAERTLAALPAGTRESVRAPLLATVALESRGTTDGRGTRAAREAEAIARRSGDPGLLALALNAVFMQSFHRPGGARHRDAVGAELVRLSARHGLPAHEVLGRLIRLQAGAALGDRAGAEEHAVAADRLAERHELPLVRVFTDGWAALRVAEDADPGDPASVERAERALRAAADRRAGCGMPGLEEGLRALSLVALRVALRQPPRPSDHTDPGPHRAWIRPLLLASAGRTAEAVAALRAAPDPPPGVTAEALWCLLGRAAVLAGDADTARRVRRALAPAAGEVAGAGTGMLTAGPVDDHLADLTDLTGRT